ncbi:MAG: type II CAAX endopeptidase family protein [Acidobacteriota bacterium]
MNSGTIFLNEFGRIRSGWRALFFLAACIFFMFGLNAIVFGILIGAGVDLDEHVAATTALGSFLSLVPPIAFGWLFGSLFEGLPFRALGGWFTGGWLKHLALGGAIGAFTIGIAALISMALGGLRFTLDISNTAESIGESLLVSLGVFIVAAAFEEALFRGYLLQTLNRAGFGPLAIAVTSVFFGSVHLMNPSANLFSTVNTMLAGVWFGVAYLKTRDLWFPFGIHLLWNWVQGSVLGIEVSGLTKLSPAPILNEIDRGPAWLTGESYGIEASVACTVAILVSIVFIHFMPWVRPDPGMLAMTSKEAANRT